MAEEKKGQEENPSPEVVEKFVEWLKADWTHVALIIFAVLFLIVLVVLLRRRS